MPDATHQSLLRALPLLALTAAVWVARQEQRILREGVALSEREREVAVRIGVANPDRVRLLQVDQVPMPGGPMLGAAASRLGFVGNSAVGMTMRYAIFIRSDGWGDLQLVAHELVHTWQYERIGGLYPFLHQYLRECLTAGYHASILEAEAVCAGASAVRASTCRE